MRLTLTAWHLLCRVVDQWGHSPTGAELEDAGELEAAGLVRFAGPTLRPTRAGAYYYSVRWFLWYRRNQGELELPELERDNHGRTSGQGI